MDEPEEFFARKFEEAAKKTAASQEKYATLIRRLSDLEFAGLYRATMEERDRRIVRLIQENPLIQRLVVEEAIQRLEETEQLIKDEAN